MAKAAKSDRERRSGAPRGAQEKALQTAPNRGLGPADPLDRKPLTMEVLYQLS
jgi:hypothetical protein